MVNGHLYLVIRILELCENTDAVWYLRVLKIVMDVERDSPAPAAIRATSCLLSLDQMLESSLHSGTGTKTGPKA